MSFGVVCWVSRSIEVECAVLQAPYLWPGLAAMGDCRKLEDWSVVIGAGVGDVATREAETKKLNSMSNEQGWPGERLLFFFPSCTKCEAFRVSPRCSWIRPAGSRAASKRRRCVCLKEKKRRRQYLFLLFFISFSLSLSLSLTLTCSLSRSRKQQQPDERLQN